MRGYAYLDLDRNLVYKTADYIETDNLMFFAENRHLIVKHWRFDTDDIESMLRLFRQVSDMKIPPDKVMNFVQCIGFDMTRLKAPDAGKV